MDARCLLLLTLFAWTAVSAQNVSQTPAKPAPAGAVSLQKEEQTEGRRSQKIERIRVEDGGATIDELRYGGQTQSINVQPKAKLPDYEFQPTDLARSRPADHRDGLSSSGSPRVWNFLRF
jgi:hypothetical protein